MISENMVQLVSKNTVSKSILKKQVLDPGFTFQLNFFLCLSPIKISPVHFSRLSPFMFVLADPNINRLFFLLRNQSICIIIQILDVIWPPSKLIPISLSCPLVLLLDKYLRRCQGPAGKRHELYRAGHHAASIVMATLEALTGGHESHLNKWDGDFSIFSFFLDNGVKVPASTIFKDREISPTYYKIKNVLNTQEF